MRLGHGAGVVWPELLKVMTTLLKNRLHDKAPRQKETNKSL